MVVTFLLLIICTSHFLTFSKAEEVSLGEVTSPCDAVCVSAPLAYNYVLADKCSYGANEVLDYPYVMAAQTVGSCGECMMFTSETESRVFMAVDVQESFAGWCPDGKGYTVSGRNVSFSRDLLATMFKYYQVGVTDLLMSSVKVPCPHTTNLGVIVRESSSSALTILLYNHVVGISTVQVQVSTSDYVNMSRQEDNFWKVVHNGAEQLVLKIPYDLIVTGTNGQELKFTLPVNASTNWLSDVQFDKTLPSTKECRPPVISPVVYTDKLESGLGLSSIWKSLSMNADLACASAAYNGSYGICFSAPMYQHGLILAHDQGFSWNGTFKAISFWAKVNVTSHFAFGLRFGDIAEPTKFDLSQTWRNIHMLLANMDMPKTIGGRNSIKFTIYSEEPALVMLDEIRFIPAGDEPSIIIANTITGNSSTTTAYISGENSSTGGSQGSTGGTKETTGGNEVYVATGDAKVTSGGKSNDADTPRPSSATPIISLISSGMIMIVIAIAI